MTEELFDMEVYVSSFHHRFVPGNFVFKELMFAASRSLEIIDLNL